MMVRWSLRVVAVQYVFGAVGRFLDDMQWNGRGKYACLLVERREMVRCYCRVPACACLCLPVQSRYPWPIFVTVSVPMSVARNA
jgi:hypothetical protein